MQRRLQRRRLIDWASIGYVCAAFGKDTHEDTRGVRGEDAGEVVAVGVGSV